MSSVVKDHIYIYIAQSEFTSVGLLAERIRDGGLHDQVPMPLPLSLVSLSP